MNDPATDAIEVLSEAFRHRNVGQALECFTDDPGTTYAGSEAGEVAVGRQALHNLLQQIFARDEAYSWAPLQVWSSPLGDCRVVMAELTGRVHRPEGAHDEEFPYRLSGILRHDGGSWRWVLCHAAEPTTPTSLP